MAAGTASCGFWHGCLDIFLRAVESYGRCVNRSPDLSCGKKIPPGQPEGLNYPEQIHNARVFQITKSWNSRTSGLRAKRSLGCGRQEAASLLRASCPSSMRAGEKASNQFPDYCQSRHHHSGAPSTSGRGEELQLPEGQGDRLSNAHAGVYIRSPSPGHFGELHATEDRHPPPPPIVTCRCGTTAPGMPCGNKNYISQKALSRSPDCRN